MVKTIDEALDKIYSYVDYSMTHAEKVSPDAFSLDTIKLFCEKRGNPQNSYPIIHVAGTKGKGSVCAMLAAALRNAGFRTGLYTSPHLIRFNERIQVDGKMISDEEIVDIINRFEETIGQVPRISSFELMTAMAFEYFRDRSVDIAIVETGLGGRLDATNIVRPLLSVITSISMDHTGFLGNTIEKIAAEKAGIIKPGIPVVCGCQPYPEALEVIKKAAAKKNSPWISVSGRFRFINVRENGSDSMMIWRVEDQKLMEKWCMESENTVWKPVVIPLALRGLHQMENAAAVYAVLNKIRSRFAGFDFVKACEGIGKTFWPCRFEILSEDKTLVADGAHNPDSIRKLGSLLDCAYGTKQIICIFGASEDKDLNTMISDLAPHVDEFIMTRSVHPRAADPKLLSRIASGIGRKNRIAPSLEDAYQIYKKDRRDNVCYLVTGSLFAAGGIREIHMKNNEKLPYFS